MEGGVWWASQAQGLVHDVPTCQQVVDTILAEAERIIEEVLPATCRPAAAQCGPRMELVRGERADAPRVDVDGVGPPGRIGPVALGSVEPRVRAGPSSDKCLHGGGAMTLLLGKP